MSEPFGIHDVRHKVTSIDNDELRTLLQNAIDSLRGYDEARDEFLRYHAADSSSATSLKTSSNSSNKVSYCVRKGK